jgi:hypothetical protein
MKKLVLSLLLFISTASAALYAQEDTLPRFSLRNVGNNRIIIGWINKFETIRQISIQRSFDSTKGYKTILTVADPTTPQNGYVDTKAPNDKMFYRLYILLEGGVYLFSQIKRPVVDTMRGANARLNGNDYNDRATRINGNDSVSIPNFGMTNKNKPDVFRPSLHVYTFKDGSVRVNLPDDEDKKFTIKFFEEDDTFLFELKDLKARTFRIDKANFYHAGWFKFELYEDGKLLEKHKFYLQKDF